MTPQETLQQHLQVCDELYQLAHEENRHLKQNRCAAPAALLETKRTLLTRLDSSLAGLRSSQLNGEGNRDAKALVEKVRGRILQILQLDKENEQLLLRVSLTRNVEPAAVPAPAPAMLQKIYGRISS